MNELDLDERFRAGDESALSEVIACYGQALLAYCHHILCDYHEAQDAVQSVFLKAWRYRAAFRPGTSMQAWLYRLAYTTSIDLTRRRKRQLFAPPPTQQRTDEGYIGEALLAALGQLSSEERALVYGRVIEERGYEELSAIIGKPAATLRKRYERARGKLARALTTPDTHEKEASI